MLGYRIRIAGLLGILALGSGCAHQGGTPDAETAKMRALEQRMAELTGTRLPESFHTDPLERIEAHHSHAWAEGWQHGRDLVFTFSGHDVMIVALIYPI